MKRYLLVGNYGALNLGDQLLKEYFLQAFPEVTFQVVSAHPREGEFPRLPGGVRSLLSFRWIRTLLELKKADGIVFGGGSLFTDVESVAACFIWGAYALAARTLQKPYFLAFQGIGPFRTGLGEGITRWVVRHASFVSVRDALSLERVQRWNLNKKVIQTFDPVFSLFEKENHSHRSNNILILMPRKNSSASFRQRSAELRERQWSDVRMLSLEEGNVPIRSLSELLRQLSGASLVLTERYHAALTAFALGIPVEIIPQAEGDKLDALKQMTGVGVATHNSLRELVSVGEMALRAVL